MKKISCVLLIVFLGTSLANAAPVKSVAAQKIAEDFYKQYSTQALKTATLAHTELSSDGDAVFYVFNVNEGFIIVAADDKALPIISYSTQGKFIVPKPKTDANVVTIDRWAAKRWAVRAS